MFSFSTVYFFPRCTRASSCSMYDHGHECAYPDIIHNILGLVLTDLRNNFRLVTVLSKISTPAVQVIIVHTNSLDAEGIGDTSPPRLIDDQGACKNARPHDHWPGPRITDPIDKTRGPQFFMSWLSPLKYERRWGGGSVRKGLIRECDCVSVKNPLARLFLFPTRHIRQYISSPNKNRFSRVHNPDPPTLTPEQVQEAKLRHSTTRRGPHLH